MSQKTWWCVGAFERKLGTETTAVAKLDSATAFLYRCTAAAQLQLPICKVLPRANAPRAFFEPRQSRCDQILYEILAPRGAMLFLGKA